MQKKSEIFKKRYFLGQALCISRVDFRFWISWIEAQIEIKIRISKKRKMKFKGAL